MYRPVFRRGESSISGDASEDANRADNSDVQFLRHPTALPIVNHGDAIQSPRKDDGRCLAAIPINLPPVLQEFEEKRLIFRLIDSERAPS